VKLYYKQEVSQYNKKDAFTALLVTAFLILLPAITLIVRLNFEPSNLYRFIVMLIYAGFSLIPIMVVLRKKQKLASIGLHRNNLMRATGLGIGFSFIPLGISIIMGIMHGWEIVNVDVFFMFLASIFFFAIFEDIVFVGYLQTRLYGLFKNSIVSILVAALIFSLMHIPSGLIMGNLSFVDIPTLAFRVFWWFSMHIIFVTIFRRYFSLITVIILHVSVNFSSMMWVAHNGLIASYSLYGLLAAAGIFVLYAHYHEKKRMPHHNK